MENNGKTNAFIRFKNAKEEYNSAEKQFTEYVKNWFDKNYKPKEGEDSVTFSSASIKGDDIVIISYSTCNFETMDKYYAGLTEDDGKYHTWTEVKYDEIFKIVD